MIGVRVERTKNYGVKIFGDPKLTLKKSFVIKNYLKDHRIFMVSAIAALTLGGNWKIYDPKSFRTSLATGYCPLPPSIKTKSGKVK